MCQTETEIGSTCKNDRGLFLHCLRIECAHVITFLGDYPEILVYCQDL